MSKTVIIYKTKYNTTKKYAGWLAIKIDADLYEICYRLLKTLNN